MRSDASILQPQFFAILISEDSNFILHYALVSSLYAWYFPSQVQSFKRMVQEKSWFYWTLATHVYLSLCVISAQNIFLQWRWPYTALSYINQNRISIISNTLHFPYIKPWNFSLHVSPQDENNNVWVSFCKCFGKRIYLNLK